jgi:Holliday junction resolvase RusA-like endonuclease
MFAKIHYASRRPDLDESLLMDLLQGVAYHNDRQIKAKVITWGLDKLNPRVEVSVYGIVSQ